MKKSLELMGLNSSGLDEIQKFSKVPDNDDDILAHVNKFKDDNSKISYLKNALEKKTKGCTQAKTLLVQLTKKTDPKLACETAISICKALPVVAIGYYLFYEVAYEHKAWFVAQSLLKVARWLMVDDVELTKNIDYLLSDVAKRIEQKEKDYSNDGFWQGKILDKYWVLERLYFQGKTDEVLKNSFKLLELFPDDLTGYDAVTKAFSILEDKTPFNDLIKFIEEKLSGDETNKNLYPGISYYYLSQFDLSINCLENVLKKDKINPKALLYLSLNYLLKCNFKDFIKTYEKVIPPSEPIYSAVFFIYSALLDFEMDKNEFPNQKNVSQALSKILENILNHNQTDLFELLIKKFIKLEIYKTLPFLFLYLSEICINLNLIPKAKELLKYSTDEEVHRLNAWIHRIEGNDKLAEEELIKYRKHWRPEVEGGIICQPINLNFPPEIPDDLNKIFEIVKDGFEQTKKLTHDLELEYGLNSMTCVETGCQDCCKKTYPYISYTEYLYLKNWLDKQPEEFKNQIREKSKKIVEKYKERFGKEAPFSCKETIDLNKDYPSDFIFDCPNLGDNKCNVYEARPFTCRAYGYCSQDNVRFKGCNYFYEQFKGATKLHLIRKTINMQSFTEFARRTDKKLLGKRVIAPIPVWFAQSHEETMEKIKQLK